MKRLILLSLVFCFGVQAAGPAPAETLDQAESRLLSGPALSDLLNYAYLSNPDIRASRASWQEFIENYRIGKSYPDPQLMTTFFPAPIETRLGPQDWNLTLSQVIPFPGTLPQKGRVLAADARISRLKVDKTVKKIVTDVSISFFELGYVRQAVKVAEANLSLLEKLTAVSDTAYAGDRALFYDISKARAQTAQVQYDILLLRELEQTETVKLNTLLNRDPGAALGVMARVPLREPAYTLDEIYELAMEHQEDILIADETVTKYQEALKLSRFENLPSFKLGLFYAGIGDPDVAAPPADAGDDAMGVQFGLNLPLWFGKNKSRTAKALSAREKARAAKISTANTVKAGISRLWFKLQNAQRLVVLYEKELLPQALSSVNTAETWFREGRGSFSDFLEVQATAYNFRLSLERAKADYGITLSRLEQRAGVILDRKKTHAKGEVRDEN